MRILRFALLYFAIVFGVGFVLGTIRTIWLVPRVGARAAELFEMPLMLVVVVVTARVVVRSQSIASTKSARLAVGCIGLILMLAAEFGFVLRLRGISIGQYLASRDPVAGTTLLLDAGRICAHAAVGGQSQETLILRVFVS
jgi:hypothetical protein